MIIYILVYILLFIFCLFDRDNVSKQTKNKILYILILVLTLFRGLRWEVGTDWDQYLDVFNSVDLSNFSTYIRKGTGEKMELIYSFLNAIVKSFGGNYTGFLIITNFFCLFSYYKISIKYSKYPIIAFTSILCSMNFFPVRQDLAIAVLLYGYKYILDRKFVKFSIVVLIAQMIHNSSFVFILLYFIYDMKISTKKMLILFISCSILNKIIGPLLIKITPFIFVLSSSLGHKLIAYTSINEIEAEAEGHSLFGALFIYLIMILSSVYVHKIKDKKEKLFMRCFYVASVLFYFIKFLFEGNLAYFSRLASAFSVVGCLLIVNTIYYFTNKWNYMQSGLRLSFPLVMIMFNLYRFYRLTGIFPEAMFPYKAIFE